MTNMNISISNTHDERRTHRAFSVDAVGKNKTKHNTTMANMRRRMNVKEQMRRVEEQMELLRLAKQRLDYVIKRDKHLEREIMRDYKRERDECAEHYNNMHARWGACAHRAAAERAAKRLSDHGLPIPSIILAACEVTNDQLSM